MRDAELLVAGDLVGVHLPDDGELDLAAVSALAVDRKAVPALPVTGTDHGMTFRTWRPGEAVTAGRFGIPVPVGGEVVPPVALDVVFVPCVAFDRAGRRLGRGGGFYDRAFDLRVRQGPPPVLVGVGFDLQLLDELVGADHDVRLDAVVTPSGLWWTMVAPGDGTRQD